MAKRKGLITQRESREVRELAKTDPEAAERRLASLVRVRRATTAFSKIDAIQSTSKRRTPRTTTQSLDDEFASKYDRAKLIATTRDLELNFSLLAGIVNAHCNKVVGSGPTLQVRTNDNGWNTEVEAYMAERFDRIDAMGVCDLARLCEIAERRRVVDGDAGFIMVRGGKLQGVEADRICDPPGDKIESPNRVTHGVEIGSSGKPVAYHVHKRTTRIGQTEYQARIRAGDFILYYMPTRFDQVRGMSPLVSAINSVQDHHETMEAVKGKTKLENMLAVAFESDQATADLNDPLGKLTEYAETAADGSAETRYEVKLGQGVSSFSLLPGEKANIIESKTPNQTFEPFTLLLVRLIGLALDMPLEVALQYYTRGSFSALRGSLGQYHSACVVKRRQIEKILLRRIYRWEMALAIGFKDLTPPGGLDPMAHTWQWPGLQLLDPDKDVKAFGDLYKLGGDTLSDWCDMHGGDWEGKLRQKDREIRYAIELSGGDASLPYPPEWLVSVPDQVAVAVPEPDGDGDSLDNADTE